MFTRFDRFYAELDRPLHRWARVAVILLALPMALSFTQPLWRIKMEAPQYPHGLYMDIYSYKLGGGHDGHDITEINELNHYIGMMKIVEGAMKDLNWIPFAFGALILLALRAGAIGSIRTLVDLSVIVVYVSLFSLVRFWYQLYTFGHSLDPHAAVHVAPFMPVMLGTKQIANFTTHGYPMAGTVLVAAFALGLMGITAWHLASEWRKGAEA